MVALTDANTMDDLVALSSALRRRHRPSTSQTLDDIPSLPPTLTPLLSLPRRALPSSPSVPPLSSLTPFRLQTPPIPQQPSHPAQLSERADEIHRLTCNRHARNGLRESMHAACVESNKTLVHLVSRMNRRSPRRPRLLPQQPVPPSAIFMYAPAIRSIALMGDAPSTPGLFHEAAALDNRHFVEMLAVLLSISGLVPWRANLTPHATVWSSRQALEKLKAVSIIGLPENHQCVAPQVIVPILKDHVRKKFGILGSSGGYDTLWATVYYCIRIGHVEAAKWVLEETAPHMEDLSAVLNVVAHFMEGGKAVDEHIVANDSGYTTDDSMNDKPEQQFIDRTQAKCQGLLTNVEMYDVLEEEYREIAWKSDDMHMRASLVLLMRLELQSPFGVQSQADAESHVANHPRGGKHETFSLSLPEHELSQIFDTVEDYLWLRLWLCRTPAENAVVDPLENVSVVDQASVQREILAFGSKHFNGDGNAPMLYAFVLVAVGLFEQAVEYLYEHTEDQYLHYAIHLGMVLYQLRWFKNERRFEDMMHEYVSRFVDMYPTEATIYLLTLRDRKQVVRLLSDVISKTEEYVLFLGSGTEWNRGIIEELLESATVRTLSGFNEDDLRGMRKKLGEVGARSALEAGNLSTAAELFQLAGLIERSAEVSARLLSMVLYVQDSPKRKRAIMEVRKIIELRISATLRSTLQLMLGIADIFEDYWTDRLLNAWKGLRKVGVLPMSAARMGVCQRQFFSEAQTDISIRPAAEALLKAAVHICERAIETGNVVRDDTWQGSGMNQAGIMTENPTMSEIRSVCIFTRIVAFEDEVTRERVDYIERIGV